MNDSKKIKNLKQIEKFLKTKIEIEKLKLEYITRKIIDEKTKIENMQSLEKGKYTLFILANIINSDYSRNKYKVIDDLEESSSALKAIIFKTSRKTETVRAKIEFLENRINSKAAELELYEFVASKSRLCKASFEQVHDYKMN